MHEAGVKPINKSPGRVFKDAIINETPLQVVGTINALCAKMAKSATFRAIYLSGAGVANAALGLPDIGVTNYSIVAEEARRITAATDLPLLVDIDTGFGSLATLKQAIITLEQANVAGVHIEDQDFIKRCGHLEGKSLVSTGAMCDRLKTALDTRKDKDFIIMARTDALSVEGLDNTLTRIKSYVDCGADMIFLEGAKSASDYALITQAIHVPILANMTEFGQTPLLDKETLKDLGIKIILYPLSAFRAMNKAALTIFEELRKQGTQAHVLKEMQTRKALYELLEYDPNASHYGSHNGSHL